MDKNSLYSKTKDLLRKISDLSLKHWISISVFFILVLILNFMVIRCDLSDIQYTKTEKSILKTYRVEGQAYYQKNESKKWYILSGEEFLSSGSHVQTYAGASLIMLFMDSASRVEVSENSQFSISETEKEVIIDFKEGEIFLHSENTFDTKKIILKMGSRFFNLSNSEVFSRSFSSGGYELQVDSGKILMQQSDTLNSFSKGQTVVFKGNKDFSVYETEIDFITPFNFDRYFVESSDAVQVRFAWNSKQKFPFVQIDLGDNPKNLKPYFSKPLPLNKNEFSIQLPKGSYYWKLSFFNNIKSKKVLSTKLQKFFIDPLVRIQPSYPEPNSEFLYLESGVPVQFQWENPSDLEKVFIEIAEDKNFNRIIYHQSVSQRNYISLTLPSEGDYYWRINGFPFKSPDLLTGVSRKFRISKNPKKNAIQIIFPVESSIVTKTMMQNSDVVFEWKSDVHALRYRVIIKSLSKNSQKQKYEYSVDKPLLKVSNLEPGKYDWYVETQSGYQSRHASFEVINSRQIYLAEKNESLYWTHSAVKKAKYRMDVLRVGTDKGLGSFYSNIKSSKQSFFLSKNTFDLKKFTDGVYVFKVYDLSFDDQIISDSNLLFLNLQK